MGDERTLGVVLGALALGHLVFTRSVSEFWLCVLLDDDMSSVSTDL